jgi:hypothetical protein
MTTSVPDSQQSLSYLSHGKFNVSQIDGFDKSGLHRLRTDLSQVGHWRASGRRAAAARDASSYRSLLDPPACDMWADRFL